MTVFNENVLAGVVGSRDVAGEQAVQVYDLPSIEGGAVEVDLVEVRWETDPEDPPGTSRQGSAAWYELMADVDWYVIVGQSQADLPDPDPGARVGLNRLQQCVRVPANVGYHRLFDSTRSALKVLNAGTVAGVLRVERTSIKLGGSNQAF